MTPIEASLLVAVPALALRWLVVHEIDKLDDPSYLRRSGVTIRRAEALEAHSGAIGRYRGCEIWGSVTFKGMLYHFERIVPPTHRVSERELVLAPGLLYLTD